MTVGVDIRQRIPRWWNPKQGARHCKREWHEIL